MADIEAAFAALEQLDEKGRKALTLAGAMWEEMWRDAVARAERAEWLLARLHKWAADWGLSFDVSKAADHWDAEHERQPAILAPWYESLVAARNEEISELGVRLACTIRSEKKVVARAIEQQTRAEAAEAERNRLQKEVERLRTVGAPGGIAIDAARAIVAIRELRPRSWLVGAHRPWPRRSSPSSR